MLLILVSEIILGGNWVIIGENDEGGFFIWNRILFVGGRGDY